MNVVQTETKMAFNIIESADGRFIELNFRNAVNQDELDKALREIHPMHIRGNCMYALIDMRRMEWLMSRIEIYNIASKIQAPPSLRIIIVSQPDESNATLFYASAHKTLRRVEWHTRHEQAKAAIMSSINQELISYVTLLDKCGHFFERLLTWQ